jgi:hypothetical protein
VSPVFQHCCASPCQLPNHHVYATNAQRVGLVLFQHVILELGSL